MISSKEIFPSDLPLLAENGISASSNDIADLIAGIISELWTIFPFTLNESLEGGGTSGYKQTSQNRDKRMFQYEFHIKILFAYLCSVNFMK